jgi:hypothetical protein
MEEHNMPKQAPNTWTSISEHSLTLSALHMEPRSRQTVVLNCLQTAGELRTLHFNTLI